MDEEVVTVGSATTAESPVSVDQVFHASYRRLVVQLYGVVGDMTEAEDLVQDAFVRASAAGRRFLRVHNHEAWLRTTAINLHRNRWRKWKNFSKIRDRLAEAPTDPAGFEEHLTLMDALRELPDSQREVIALHYLADLPVAEVADTVGCPENTVKTRLRRARAALAVTLQGEEGTDD